MQINFLVAWTSIVLNFVHSYTSFKVCMYNTDTIDLKGTVGTYNNCVINYFHMYTQKLIFLPLTKPKTTSSLVKEKELFKDTNKV